MSLYFGDGGFVAPGTGAIHTTQPTSPAPTMRLGPTLALRSGLTRPMATPLAPPTANIGLSNTVKVDLNSQAVLDAKLKALQDQQTKADIDAATAAAADEVWNPEPTFMEQYGQWLWVGAGVAGLALVGIGFYATRKKSVAGYRRRKKR